MRKLILLSFTLLAFAANYQSNAQVVITTVGLPYSQDFDSLSNDTTFTTAHAMSLNGWSIFEKGSSSAVDQMYKVNHGTRNNGETYSYGDTLSTDRALGSLASGTNLPAFGVGFKNGTGANITGFNVAYKGEQWRSGDTVTAALDSLIFEYSTTATGINDTVASWNPVASLMFNTPNLTTNIVGALNGNIAPNTANVTATISVLIPNNGTIYLRWRDINKSGSDDGLAIDDLLILFSSTGNPKPSITSTTPPDDAFGVSPATTNLTLTFDQPVVVGTGNVIVKNLTDASIQTIACGTTTIAGSTVTIPGVNLVAGKQYAVNFDSTCYASATAANSNGIYDNTSWNFETMPNALIDWNKNNLDMSLLANEILSFTISNASSFNLTILDINGKVVKQQSVNAQSGLNKISINTNQLGHGVYFIRLSNKEYQGTLKFTK